MKCGELTISRRNPRRGLRHRRAGSAAVEFALCLPVCLAIGFGMIETTQAIFVKRSLATAAYEGGNVATAIGGTSIVAEERALTVATLLGVKAMQVTVSPVVTTNTPTGTPVTVTCTADLSKNALTGWALGNMTLKVTHTAIHL